MESSADSALSDLVRRALPRPRRGEDWYVELVDDVECATVDRLDNPIVRVHRTWRESIYDAGFAHVARHYPLALEPRGNQDVACLPSARNLMLWRGKAIKRVYWAGAFTGQLRLVPVFVAKTHDGLGIYAHHKPECAAKAALTERRSKLKQEEIKKRHIEALRQEAHQILRRRLQADRNYDSGYRVALAPYKKLLPLAEFLARDVDTAPLIVLEHESVGAILHMPWNDVLELFNRLSFDISVARSVFVQRALSADIILAEEDGLALARLAALL